MYRADKDGTIVTGKVASCDRSAKPEPASPDRLERWLQRPRRSRQQRLRRRRRRRILAPSQAAAAEEARKQVEPSQAMLQRVGSALPVPWRYTPPTSIPGRPDRNPRHGFVHPLLLCGWGATATPTFVERRVRYF